MAKGNSQKKGDGSALDFEAQLWAAAEQAVPAPHLLVAMLEPYKGRVFETLQSANTSCSNRRMNRGRTFDFVTFALPHL